MASTPDTEVSSDRDPLDVLAEEYARRCRRGESPSVEEFAARYPEFADEIRQLLPAVAFLERGKNEANRSGLNPGSNSGARTGEFSGLGHPNFERLGENRIIREIGRGGMGIVYEAVQEPLGRRVAVKILPRHAHRDAINRQRFLREAQVVAKLQHPHIVPIYTIGEQDGLPYYVMPLIDGAGLDRLLMSKPSSTTPVERARWVARLGLQAASALAFAHGQNILHRDIKPANLLLDREGTLWLADFGLAKLADDLSLTGTGELPGTLRYLAPECLHKTADERSDVYSLGLTLYEMLVGRPAFLEMDRVRLLHQIEAQNILAPRRLVPALPRDIETIILKAMAHDPSARYPTATALGHDLQRFLDGHPIQARRTSLAERAVRWGRRNPVVAALTVTSIVLGLTAAILLRFYLHPPRHDHPNPTPSAVALPVDSPESVIDFELQPGDPIFGPPLPPPPPPPPRGPHPPPPPPDGGDPEMMDRPPPPPPRFRDGPPPRRPPGPGRPFPEPPPE